MSLPSEPPDLPRRGFLKLAAAGAGLAAAPSLALAAAPSETASNILPQPAPEFGDDLNTSDVLVETLIAWGATHVFGVVGDGINSIIEALRKRRDRIAYIGVRHEEAAAFMASGIAKHTGRLGVCLGTTGPGAVHLLNGLWDAHFDGAPVVALTGLTFHDLRGTRYQQGIDTTKLMEPLALYNEEVTGPQHAILIGNRACRAALGERGVAHLAVSKDVQMMKLSADKEVHRQSADAHVVVMVAAGGASGGAGASGRRRSAQFRPPRRHPRRPGRLARARRGRDHRRPARRAGREIAARPSGDRRRFAVLDRRDRPSGDGAVLVGDEGVRFRANPGVDDALGGVLSRTRSGERRADRPQARSDWPQVSGGGRAGRRRQGDAAGARAVAETQGQSGLSQRGAIAHGGLEPAHRASGGDRDRAAAAADGRQSGE